MNIKQIQKKQDDLQVKMSNLSDKYIQGDTEYQDKLLELFELKDELQAEIDKLKASVRENRTVEEWPKYQETYFYINSWGKIEESRWNNDPIDKGRKSQGNIARTREELEMKKLRREARAERWCPEPHGTYWYWDYIKNEAVCDNYVGVIGDTDNYWNGNTHRTEEEAIAYGKKYGESFKLTVLK